MADEVEVVVDSVTEEVTIQIMSPAGGTVTSVGIVGTDGIEVDSGSPVTTAGNITLGLSSTVLSQLNLADSAVQSVVAGANVSVDSTDPQNPIVSVTGMASGDVEGPESAVNNNLTAFDGTSGKLIKDSGIATSAVVQTSRNLTAGTGLTGGGDLSADRSFALSASSIASLALADSAVQPGDLSPVATSGDYNDLFNLPTLGALAPLNSVNDSNWSGAPLSIGNGGIGTSLTDPNADRILFWDDSVGAVCWLTVGTNLSISGTTLNATGGGGGGGDVFGPASSTDGNVTVFDGVTGKLIKESGIASSNLILSTGSYNDPTWLTGLGWSKLNSIPTPVNDLAGLSVVDGFLKYSGGTLGVSNVAPSDISPVSGYSVVGVSAASGAAGAITAGADNQVLRRSGTTLGFGAINLASSSAVSGLLPYSNLADLSARSVLGRSGATSGVMAAITAGADGNILRRSGTTIDFGSINVGLAAAVNGSLRLTNGGLGASLTAPGSDGIFFYDVSAASTTFLSPGNSIAITGTTLDTIQDIRTSATPTFQKLALLNAGVVSQFRINNSAGSDGVYFMTAGGSNFQISGGAEFSGGWIARSSAASIFGGDNGEARIYTDSGLTPGVGYTPTIRFLMQPTGETVWTVKNFRVDAGSEISDILLLGGGNTGSGNNTYFRINRTAAQNGSVLLDGLITGVGPTAPLCFNSEGLANIGIGTNNPQSQLHAVKSDASTNSISEIARFSHSTSGTATTGFGARISTELENGSGVNRISSSLDTVFTDASNASEDAELIVNAIAAGSLAESARFSGSLGVRLTKTITPAGTTGNQVINTQCGSVNFAAGATSLTVTNNRVTTSSVIIPVVATNDMDMTSVQAVAGSGSFVLYSQPATPSAEVRVDFLVLS